MKLSIKIPLLIGLVLLVSIGSITIALQILVTDKMEAAAYSELSTEARISAELIAAVLNSELIQLEEIANRARTRTMDWEGVVFESLVPEVARIGVADMALVFPDGSTYTTLHLTTENSYVGNLSDRDYIQAAFGGTSVMSDTILNRLTNSVAVMMAAPVFQSSEPRAPVIGLVIARKDARAVLDQALALVKPAWQSGYAFLINKEGDYIAHPDQALVHSIFNPIQEASNDPSLRSLSDMIEHIINENEGTASYTQRGDSRINAFMEIPGYNNWKLIVSIERDDFESDIRSTMRLVLLIGAICLIISIAAALYVGRSIANPIRRVTLTLEDISEGEGDLTRNVTVKSNDELGLLARYFNKTIEKIKAMVINIKIEAQALSEIGTALSNEMNETAAAMNEITANVQGIKNRVLNQSAGVSETHATMEQVVGNINKLNDHVENQSENISQASSAIEQMVANIQSVTATLVNNVGNVSSLKEASEVGRTGLSDVASDIQEIARESEGLLEINSVMENIASQTNLLSMNAAIEAAHAGEAGKGFAVVADEIRKLAESSSNQSKTIGAVLKKIKSSIDKITQSTGNVLNKFEAIDTNIKVVAEQEDNVRSAMEEQGIGSKQLLQGVGNVNDITRQVKSGSNEMLEGAKEVIRESENLEKATQEITLGMNEMSDGADRVNQAVNNVNDISRKNRDAIDVLIKEVSRFKVE
ncbi:MAG: methyl-accepting chemotaxis protein [Treponema sp.]|nr:methyl-accepting chemotaxis protein [Treponema sp.]